MLPRRDPGGPRHVSARAGGRRRRRRTGGVARRAWRPGGPPGAGVRPPPGCRGGALRFNGRPVLPGLDAPRLRRVWLPSCPGAPPSSATSPAIPTATGCVTFPPPALSRGSRWRVSRTFPAAGRSTGCSRAESCRSTGASPRPQPLWPGANGAGPLRRPVPPLRLGRGRGSLLRDRATRIRPVRVCRGYGTRRHSGTRSARGGWGARSRFGRAAGHRGPGRSQALGYSRGGRNAGPGARPGRRICHIQPFRTPSRTGPPARPQAKMRRRTHRQRLAPVREAARQQLRQHLGDQLGQQLGQRRRPAASLDLPLHPAVHPHRKRCRHTGLRWSPPPDPRAAAGSGSTAQRLQVEVSTARMVGTASSDLGGVDPVPTAERHLVRGSR